MSTHVRSSIFSHIALRLVKIVNGIGLREGYMGRCMSLWYLLHRHKIGLNSLHAV